MAVAFGRKAESENGEQVQNRERKARGYVDEARGKWHFGLGRREGVLAKDQANRGSSYNSGVPAILRAAGRERIVRERRGGCLSLEGPGVMARPATSGLDRVLRMARPYPPRQGNDRPGPRPRQLTV
eukprot:764106-Hanusia_phi.AAC.10